MITSLVEPGGARPGDATRRTVIFAMIAYTALATIVAGAASTGAGLGVIALGVLFTILIDLRQWRDIVDHDRAKAPPQPARVALQLRNQPLRAIAPPSPTVTQVFTTTRLLPYARPTEPALLERASDTAVVGEPLVADAPLRPVATDEATVPATVSDPVAETTIADEERDTASRLAALPKDASAEDKANAVGARPTGFDSPRGGQADDLKRINGIGLVNEKKLNALGVYHFDQIAAWQRPEIRWVAAYLAFPGRIDREGWIDQAARLAAEAKS